MKIKFAFYVLVLVAFLAAKEKTVSSSWTETGKDAEYPEKSYLVGLGVSEISAAKAAQNAMVQVAQQISAQVDSKWTSQKEVSGDGKDEQIQEDIKSQNTIKTEGQLEGIQIVRKTVKDSVYYALAVLNKTEFIRTQQEKIAEKSTLAQSQFQAAQKAYVQFDFELFWNNLHQAYQKVGELTPLRTQIRPLASVEQTGDSILSVSMMDEWVAIQLAKIKINRDTSTKHSFIQVTLNKQKLAHFELDFFDQGVWLGTLKTGQEGRVEIPIDSLLPGVHALSVIPKWKFPKTSLLGLKKYQFSWKQTIESLFKTCVLQPVSPPQLNTLVQAWKLQLQASASNSIELENQVQLKMASSNDNLPSKYEVVLRLKSNGEFIELTKKVLAKSEDKALSKAYNELNAWDLKPLLEKICP